MSQEQQNSLTWLHGALLRLEWGGQARNMEHKRSEPDGRCPCFRLK